jgi:hypothetical protein
MAGARRRLVAGAGESIVSRQLPADQCQIKGQEDAIPAKS